MRRSTLFLLVAAVPLLLYARTATFGFVQADDADLIAGNQAFLSDLRNVPGAFERSYFDVGDASRKTYYRPVAIVSFMIDAAAGGDNPRLYHATNVVLHAAVTCLLFALAVAWGAPRAAAAAAALIFAVHPLNVQAVAWIAGRNDLLLAVFGLLSMLFWPRWERDGSATVVAVAGHAIAFALALFSKETGICFPLLAVLHQRLVAHEHLTRAQRIALAVDAAIVAAWAFLRARALAGTPSELSIDALRTMAVNAPQLLVHAGKMLLPGRLNVSPGVDTITLLAGVLAVALFARIAWRSKSRRAATLGACWALAFLIPTLIVPGMPAYEHRAYLPLIGVVASLATGLGISLKPGGRALTARQIGMIPVAIVAAILIVLAALTFQRQEVFRDAYAYWNDGTRDAQFGAIAHVNLGQLRERDGDAAGARREYLRALERDPDTPKAHNNLGVVLMSLNEPELAEAHFKEEARRHPWNADAWFNLGLRAEETGQPAVAREYYERAVRADPSYGSAYDKLGIKRRTK